MPGGRPTKLTPALQAKLCKLIRAGNFRNIAAAAVGIPARTLQVWLAKGKQSKTGVYREFRHALMAAEKAAETDMVALIIKAAKKDAKHAEWWLERKHHKRWGRRDRIQAEVAGKNGGPVEHVLVYMPDNGRDTKTDNQPGTDAPKP